MALIITGFLSGIIGGMGIGGGTILIPIMTIFLGFDQNSTGSKLNLFYTYGHYSPYNSRQK